MNDEIKSEAEGQSPIPPIRTYKSDVAATLGSQKQTLSGLVASEEKRRRMREEGGAFALPEERPWWRTKNILFVAGGIVFLAAAASLGVFFFQELSAPEEKTVTPASKDIISSEYERQIPLVRLSRGELETRVAQELETLTIPLNSIAAFHFVREEQVPGTLEKRTVPVTAAELLGALQSDIPSQLTRTLTDEFFFGAYSFRRMESFLVLRTNFYDGAFLGMLQWEASLAQDASPLLGIIGTSPVPRGSFRDAVIDNTDVRILTDGTGEGMLLYSFTDRNTIVIARSAETFREAARRLRTAVSATR